MRARTERHGPHRALPRPVCYLVQRREHILCTVRGGLQTQLRRAAFRNLGDGLSRVGGAGWYRRGRGGRL